MLTQEAYIDCQGTCLHVMLDPEADLDGEFEALCLDKIEMLSVKGWIVDEITFL